VAASFQGVCDVCDLIDGDKSEKTVICCPACSAQVCAADNRYSVDVLRRRGKAWFMRDILGKGHGKRECK
jgi:hypothetical protein